MIRRLTLTFLLIFAARLAGAQSTGILASGGIGSSCTAVTTATSNNPGTAGGCTAFALVTSGGSLPNSYSWTVSTTGSPASITVNFMGSTDGISWTQIDTTSAAGTKSANGGYRFLGCVPATLSGGSSPTITCTISVSAGGGGTNPSSTCGDSTHALGWSGTAYTCQAITGSAAAGGSTTQLQFNNATALGGISGWTTNGTTTITGAGTSILNLGSLTLANLTFPTAASTGFLRVTTTTGALSSGEVSGDCTTSASFSITCTKTSGTAFSTLATTTPGTGVATFLATPSSANLLSAMTTSTGSGNLVFATSPTLVTPALGTPASATLTNATGLPIATGVSGLGTGVATFLATPSSANLFAAVTGSTGSGGGLVFATGPTLSSPTFVTPALGTPASGVLTNATGLPLSGLTSQAADTVDMNASGVSASPTAVAMPTTGTNGCAGSANALLYNTTTHSWGCNTISGSGTVNSGTATHLAFYSSTTNAVSSDATATDDGTTLTYTGTGGLSVTAGPVSISAPSGDAGYFNLVGNTANQSVTANTVGLMGPTSATFTAYALQLPATGPSGNQILQCGTPTASVSACTFTSAGSGTVSVVGAGSLTSTALVTGGGSQTLQTPSATSTLDSSGNLAVAAGGSVGSADTGTPKFTFATNSISANQPLSIAKTTNQMVMGTTTNLSTLTFPASSGAVTLTFPNTTTLMLGGNSDTTATDICHAGTAGLCNFTALVAGDIPTSGISNVVYKNTTNAATSAMTLDMSAATGSAALKVPSTTTNTASAAGVIDYDTTNSNYHANSGADSLVGIVPTASVPANGDVIDASVASSKFLLHDSGVATANLTTAASNFTSGNLVQAAGNNKTESDSGVATANVVQATSAATSAKQICTATSTTKSCSYIDFPERFYLPAANCNNTTAGAGWNIGSGGTVACRAGTNNLGGAVQITDTSSTFAQTPMITIPVDWDTGTNPYIKFYFSVVTDTTNGHTVIPQIKVSCPTAGNGTVSDDATFSAAQSSSTVTLGASAVANGFYNGSSVQIGSTQMTGCIAGGVMIVQIGRATDTVTGNVNFWGVDVTFPRLLTVQAN